jgi:hypothetical protein
VWTLELAGVCKEFIIFVCTKEGGIMKSKTSATQNLFKEHKSYSPDEIIAAGGATAFGEKMGKNRDSLIKALENAPKPEPFTEEEWADLMADLARDK